MGGEGEGVGTRRRYEIPLVRFLNYVVLGGDNNIEDGVDNLSSGSNQEETVPLEEEEESPKESKDEKNEDEDYLSSSGEMEDQQNVDELVYLMDNNNEDDTSTTCTKDNGSVPYDEELTSDKRSPPNSKKARINLTPSDDEDVIIISD